MSLLNYHPTEDLSGSDFVYSYKDFEKHWRKNKFYEKSLFKNMRELLDDHTETRRGRNGHGISKDDLIKCYTKIINSVIKKQNPEGIISLAKFYANMVTRASDNNYDKNNKKFTVIFKELTKILAQRKISSKNNLFLETLLERGYLPPINVVNKQILRKKIEDLQGIFRQKYTEKEDYSYRKFQSSYLLGKSHPILSFMLETQILDKEEIIFYMVKESYDFEKEKIKKLMKKYKLKIVDMYGKEGQTLFQHAVMHSAKLTSLSHLDYNKRSLSGRKTWSYIPAPDQRLQSGNRIYRVEREIENLLEKYNIEKTGKYKTRDLFQHLLNASEIFHEKYSLVISLYRDNKIDLLKDRKIKLKDGTEITLKEQYLIDTYQRNYEGTQIRYLTKFIKERREDFILNSRNLLIEVSHDLQQLEIKNNANHKYNKSKRQALISLYKLLLNLNKKEINIKDQEIVPLNFKATKLLFMEEKELCNKLKGKVDKRTLLSKLVEAKRKGTYLSFINTLSSIIEADIKGNKKNIIKVLSAKNLQRSFFHTSSFMAYFSLVKITSSENACRLLKTSFSRDVEEFLEIKDSFNKNKEKFIFTKDYVTNKPLSKQNKRLEEIAKADYKYNEFYDEYKKFLKSEKFLRECA